jgi:hypothetical protein
MQETYKIIAPLRMDKKRDQDFPETKLQRKFMTSNFGSVISSMA